MATKTAADEKRKPYPARKKTEERTSNREDGRLATQVYLTPKVLADVQAAAKAEHQPTWAFIERILERAMKSRKAK